MLPHKYLSGSPHFLFFPDFTKIFVSPFHELDIKEINFEGGGGKGIANIGATEVLEKTGILFKTEMMSGSSVGAITALFLALGATAEFLLQKAYQENSFLNDMPEFEKKYEEYFTTLAIAQNNQDGDITDVEGGLGFALDWVFSLARTVVNQGAWSAGVKLRKFLEETCLELLRLADESISKNRPDQKGKLFNCFLDPSNPTFAELANAKLNFPEANFRNLSVAITDPNGEHLTLNKGTAPGRSIIESVHISASFPFAFSKVNGHTDGGFAKNTGAVSQFYPPQQCLIFGFVRESLALDEAVSSSKLWITGTLLEFGFGSNPFLNEYRNRTEAENNKFGYFIKIRYGRLTTLNLNPTAEFINEAVAEGRESTLEQLNALVKYLRFTKPFSEKKKSSPGPV